MLNCENGKKIDIKLKLTPKPTLIDYSTKEDSRYIYTKQSLLELLLLVVNELKLNYYTKPESGIPRTDLAEDINNILSKWELVTPLDTSKYVKRSDLKNIAFTANFLDLTNVPKIEKINIDNIFSNTSENPVQNKVIFLELSNKLDKLNSKTSLFVLNGLPVTYGSSISIANNPDVPNTYTFGRGTIDEAIAFAADHLDENFTWLLEFNENNTTIRKMIWHITNPSMYIDAFGAIINKD